jgi:hypothetical protein
MKARLRDFGLPTSIAVNAEQYQAETLVHLAPTDTLRIQVTEAYAHGLHATFVVMAIFAGVAFLLSFLIKHQSMDKILKSNYRVQR